jgi:uncharacterized protein YndB with AHSA1/START domain
MPVLIKRWWAGERGTVTIADVDLRVGGRWRYVLVADGGLEVAFHGEYREIFPHTRIVNTEVFEGIPDADEPVSIQVRASGASPSASQRDRRSPTRVAARSRSRLTRAMRRSATRPYRRAPDSRWWRKSSTWG